MREEEKNYPSQLALKDLRLGRLRDSILIMSSLFIITVDVLEDAHILNSTF